LKEKTMRRDGKRFGSDQGWVTASEIAAFVYCQESWRLAELGLEPGNQEALDAGNWHHAMKTLAERIASVLLGMGRMLVFAAVLVLLAVFLWLVWR
jgi:hypothetical protein